MSRQNSSILIEFERENQLVDLFVDSLDLSMIGAERQKDVEDRSWFMAFARYLKRRRSNPDENLFRFLNEILRQTFSSPRELLKILRQTIFLYPQRLISLNFQRHLTELICQLDDSYLNYKYSRLLRLIIDQVDRNSLKDVFPSIDVLLEKFSQFDSSLIIVLEHFVFIHHDVELQLKLNEFYSTSTSFFVYLQSKDFDDDELIDFCSILFQISRHSASLRCRYSANEILLSLLIFIDYETETMFNWLLSPETGETFLILILRLVKYFASHRDEFQSDCHSKILPTFRQFYQRLTDARDKSLSTMGRIFLDHLGGQRIFSCANCDTPLTNRSELVSTRFTGATGRAFLFNHVVNTKPSSVQERMMLTGRHFVRDVSCKKCDVKLGWIYEFATEDSQRYKEGRIILERALIKETDGF